MLTFNNSSITQHGMAHSSLLYKSTTYIKKIWSNLYQMDFMKGNIVLVKVGKMYILFLKNLLGSPYWSSDVRRGG